MKQKATLLLILLIFGFACVPTLPASAQSVDLTAAFKQYQSLKQQGKYAEATPFAKTVIDLVRAEFGIAPFWGSSGTLSAGGPFRNHSLFNREVGRYLSMKSYKSSPNLNLQLDWHRQ
jgi:hypothetical protein